jgi:SAM-dependent methyltransferase
MMEFTGERYIPSLTGEIYYEHVHRYAIAAPACAGKRVLDLASGEGWGAALLARHATEVVGIDIDAATIEHARRSYYLANLRFMTASATDIPLPDASVDVVTSFETIEHLSDHDRMLDEFRRVLAPGGTLFISSPNKLVYSDLTNFRNPFHVRELYYQEFRDLLTRRFANVEIYGQRFINSSVLHPLSGLPSDAAGWYAGDLSAIGDGLPTFAAPVYFVAVCSDGPLYDRVASGFVDPHDDLYSHLRHELEMLRARVSLDPALPSGDAAGVLTSAPQFALTGGQRDGDDALHDDIETQRLVEEALAAEHEAALAAERDLRAGLESEISSLRRDAETNLAQLRAELASATAAREALERRIAEIDDSVTERDAALTARDLRLAELKRALAERSAEIGRRDALIAQRDAAVAEYDATVRQRDAALAERDARIAELEQAVAARGTRIAALTTMAAERDAMEARIVVLQGRLVQEHAATIAFRERAENDGAMLRDILGSRSWKVTALLRRAAGIVRGRRPT